VPFFGSYREETFVNFDWNRSETIAVAKESCSQCQGLGLRSSTSRKGSSEAPCNCVLRGIFRACYSRFRHCLQKEKRMSQVRFEIIGGQERRPVWGRKDEEYVADFCLASDFISSSARTGSSAAASSNWRKGCFFTRSTASSRSWVGRFVNWSRMLCSHWTNISPPWSGKKRHPHRKMCSRCPRQFKSGAC
jgi:hypothetical protein